MPPEVDLLIVGGGCAGLSLAMHLAQHPQRAPNTLILEQRQHYENDKTWCFWGDDETPFATLAAHQWRAVKVSHAGRVARLDCSATAYRMLASEQFYAAAVTALFGAPKLQLQMQTSLLSEAKFKAGRWHFQSTHGPLSAAMVVDTRPVAPSASAGAVLWQSFYGHEIDCSEPVFEPGCVELMDFSSASSARVAFSYVLPMSPTRALVEFTVFAPQPFSAAALSAELNAAVAQRVKGAAFTLRRSEQGVLPMGLTQPKALAGQPEQASTYVRAGLFAGAARPATGYAFQRIQRWAADCAAQLAGGGPPIGHRPDAGLLAWMDNLFLQLIQRRPELAPSLFVDLFARVGSPRLIRFLSDRGRLADYAAMILALPCRPFVQQLMLQRSWP